MKKFPRVASYKTPEAFRARLQALELGIDLEDQVAAAEGPLAQPIRRNAGTVGNRFCILPMEGWDGTSDGKPTDLTRRRWKNFGLSGAKLIWGGEAVAVRHDGRANPNQLILTEENTGDLASLRELLVAEHQEQFGSTDDLLVGLQLTHSGRFARPTTKGPAPRTAYRHPVLDSKVGIDNDQALFNDEELDQLVEDFVAAAVRAQKAGYAFVDVKHCHGYFGHELLTGYDRTGAYGGSLEGRTRFLEKIVTGIRSEAPGLEVGVRLSLFDFSPYQPGGEGVGVPSTEGPYPYAFGGDGTGQGIDLTETHALVKHFQAMGITLLCTTAGSPYYNPHIQRPATFPPSDGYSPPEDPLVGVARQIRAAGEIKQQHPNMLVVGSGYSYLQDWLPHVAQWVVRNGMADSIGLGRMVLSYPDLPADVLAGKLLTRKKVCRTFSDCTTAPRNGIISGCYPLDPFYKERPEFDQLAKIKKSPK